MLLFLNDSICNANLHDDNISIDSLDNILRNAYEGKNVVISSRQCLVFLLANKNVFSRAPAFFISRLKNEYSTLCGIIHSVDSYIEVGTDYCNLQKQGSVFCAPLSFFQDSGSSSSTNFICENLIDCEVYEYAAHHYAIKNSIRGFVLNSNHRLGGGSTTALVLQRLITQGSSLVLCILDGDQFHPDGRLGATAWACNNVSVDNAIASVITTNERELENFIPENILSRAIKDGEVTAWHNEITKLQYIDGGKLYGHIDIKNGTKLFWVYSNMPSQSAGRQFWNNSILNNQHSFPRIQNECIENGECGENNLTNCQCIVNNGLSENILKHVIEWLRVTSLHKSCEAVNETDETWLTLGKVVFEWCFTYKPTRT